MNDPKWYHFDQNNSGGVFDVNEKLCHRLFIQAAEKDEACSIAEAMGVYFNGCDDGIDCECCGDRWYGPSEETFPLTYTTGVGGRGESIVFDNAEQYAQYLADNYGWTVPDCRIFYKNGDVKEIFSVKKTDEETD